MSRLLELQQKIADEYSASDIECFLDGSRHSGRHHGWWYDTTKVTHEECRETVSEAIEYLELRGLLKHHPDNCNLIRPIHPK